ncbi:hypothetical protein [Planomonospora sp. ID82291]|uniref:hypothetical protein n=1 Tax=Planomonospora sp. ID82291 TaxID=2738136 RepID=UPI0018C3A16A|nr:hypothetical protein [Planomonospora sp. ID82291]MBG0815712.1 hypothetical protein [Planomonospora sp. ID82291]
MRTSERLWHLVHRYGLGSSFTGVWVENREISESVRILGVDTTTGVDCTWADINKEREAGNEQGFIWAGRINSHWIQLIYIGVEAPDALPKLTEGDRRVLLISWHVNSAGKLIYARNGDYATIFDITRPDRQRGADPHALDQYAEGLMFDAHDTSWENDPELLPGWLEYSRWEELRLETEASDDDYDNMPTEWMSFLELAANGYSPQLATCITSAFILVGRIVGQELDEAWMEGVHTRFAFTGVEEEQRRIER